MDSYWKNLRIVFIVLVLTLLVFLLFFFFKYKSPKKEVSGLVQSQYVQEYPESISYFIEGNEEILKIKGKVENINNNFLTISLVGGDILKLKYDENTKVVDVFSDKNVSGQFKKNEIKFTGEEYFAVTVDGNKNLLLKGIYRFKL